MHELLQLNTFEAKGTFMISKRLIGDTSGSLTRDYKRPTQTSLLSHYGCVLRSRKCMPQNTKCTPYIPKLLHVIPRVCCCILGTLAKARTSNDQHFFMVYSLRVQPIFQFSHVNCRIINYLTIGISNTAMLNRFCRI